VLVKGGEYPHKVNFVTPEESIRVSQLTYKLGSFTIKVEAFDVNGNSAVVEQAGGSNASDGRLSRRLDKEKQSWVAAAVDYLIDVIAGALEAAWEGVKALGGMFKDWIIEQVKLMWNAVIDPLLAAAQEYIDGIMAAMQDFFKEINDFDWEGSSEMPDGFDIKSETNDVMTAGMAFGMSFIGLQEYSETVVKALQTIISFIEPFTSFCSISTVISLIGHVPQIDGLLSTISNLQETAISSFVTSVFGKSGFLNRLGFYSIESSSSSMTVSPYSFRNFMVSIGCYHGFTKLVCESLIQIFESDQTRWVAEIIILLVIASLTIFSIINIIKDFIHVKPFSLIVGLVSLLYG